MTESPFANRINALSKANNINLEPDNFYLYTDRIVWYVNLRVKHDSSGGTKKTCHHRRGTFTAYRTQNAVNELSEMEHHQL